MSLLIQFKETPLKRGAWSVDEDNKLVDYIRGNGIWNWNEIPQVAGLARTGKSCRLRWLNYLRPNLKHGNFTKEEDETILKLHKKHGNKWATIAAKLPGRSDNEIKNHFNTRLRKIAEKQQAISLHRKSSAQASSTVKIDQNYSVFEQNSSSAPTSMDPSPTSSRDNYSSSPDTSNLISSRNDHHEIIRFEAPAKEQTGDQIWVDQLQLSVERMCMWENDENYIGEMFGEYEGYGMEACFNVQGGDNVMLEDVDDFYSYFWIDLFNHGTYHNIAT